MAGSKGSKKGREAARKSRKSAKTEMSSPEPSSESDADSEVVGEEMMHEATRAAKDQRRDQAQSFSEDDDGDAIAGDDEGGDDGEGARISSGSLPVPASTGAYVNKQRCLVLCSRGVTSRHRHFLEDLRTLIPHMKKDSKLDDKQNIGAAVTEVATLKSCNSALFMECRKRQDVYLWAGLTPNGPSAKFHLSNLHTMDELKLTGNCMKGSRPLLSFDASFGDSTQPHLQLIKELFVDIFGTPRGHPKSKPFIDRVMCFYLADNRIWVRNYQIVEEEATNAKEARQRKLDSGLNTSLVEIGPRFVLNPIRIFAGSFSGQTLYQNPSFVSPNEIRSRKQRDKGQQYAGRKQQQQTRKDRMSDIDAMKIADPLADVFR